MARGELQKPFRQIALPSTIYTREVGIAIKVSVKSENPVRLPILGDTYSASKLTPKVRLKEYGSYICTDIQGDGDYFWVYFSKNKTAAQAEVPFKPVLRNMGNHPWPPVLIKVDTVLQKMKRAVNAGDRFYRGNVYKAIPTYVPSADTGTLFELREYLSPTEFVIPQWPTPITGSVNFPVPGNRDFSFGECLHDDITIEQMIESEDVIETVGSAVSNNIGLFSGSSFPATNFKTWGPYYLYDRQTKLATGAWHRTQMRVIPPPLPKRVRG